jgi:membrane-associated phospholipid phosphatase
MGYHAVVNSGTNRLRRFPAVLAVFALIAAADVVRAQESPTTPPSAAAQATPEKPAESPKQQSVSFLKSLGHDFINLATPSTLVILGTGGAAALAVHHEDAHWTEVSVENEGLENTLDPGQVVGSGWVQGGAAVATMALGHFTSPRVADIGAKLVRAQIVNFAITQPIKHAVNRPRPDGTRYSFPSGHASSSFATAAVLQRELGWKVGAAAYGMAAYASWSRLSENKHYASDVIFGAAIGLVSGRCVTVRGQRFAVGPGVIPGGVMVSFTHVER